MSIRNSIVSAALTLIALALAGLPVVASMYGGAHMSSGYKPSGHSTPRTNLLDTPVEQTTQMS